MGPFAGGSPGDWKELKLSEGNGLEAPRRADGGGGPFCVGAVP